MLVSKVRDVQSLLKIRHSIHETSGDQNVHDIILSIVVWRKGFCPLGFIYLLLSDWCESFIKYKGMYMYCQRLGIGEVLSKNCFS